MRTAGVVAAVAAVVVVGAGAVVADRVLAGVAERSIATAIEQNFDGVAGAPHVEVEGFPFLTQVARGSLDRISGSVQGVTLGGIDARDVAFDGRDVSTDRPYTVGDATVSATLRTDSLERLVDDRTGLSIDLAVVNGALRASGTVLGLPLAADLAPHVAEGGLVVDLERVTIGGIAVSTQDLPGAVGDRLQGLRVPVSGLPDGLALSGARVVTDGVRITATGQDVELPTS